MSRALEELYFIQQSALDSIRVFAFILLSTLFLSRGLKINNITSLFRSDPAPLTCRKRAIYYFSVLSVSCPPSHVESCLPSFSKTKLVSQSHGAFPPSCAFYMTIVTADSGHNTTDLPTLFLSSILLWMSCSVRGRQ